MHQSEKEQEEEEVVAVVVVVVVAVVVVVGEEEEEEEEYLVQLSVRGGSFILLIYVSLLSLSAASVRTIYIYIYKRAPILPQILHPTAPQHN